MRAEQNNQQLRSDGKQQGLARTRDTIARGLT
jgi:hypothetical protein